MKTRRGWAWPLVPVYATALALKNGLRRVGLLRTRTLAWPVVSVGSLSAGGAGKTPVVIALARLLGERGWQVDVLSRGYGRDGRVVERVDSEDPDAARRFGDEPVLISQRTSVPVWVGADRFAAGIAAEWGGAEARKADSSPLLRNDRHGPLRDDIRRAHLLDDGFQHRGLARTVDVVLVTADDLEDALLPAGNRRERLPALWRADVVILREDEREQIEARVRGLMRDGAAVWGVRRQLRLGNAAAECHVGSSNSDLARMSSPSVQSRTRWVAFCAIARPEGFWAMLAEAGCGLLETVAFGDHHSYTAADVERLVKVAKDRSAPGFVTTEKDAVKLSTAMLERLRSVGPVCVAALDATFVDEADVITMLEAMLR